MTGIGDLWFLVSGYLTLTEVLSVRRVSSAWKAHTVKACLFICTYPLRLTPRRAKWLLVSLRSPAAENVFTSIRILHLIEGRFGGDECVEAVVKSIPLLETLCMENNRDLSDNGLLHLASTKLKKLHLVGMGGFSSIGLGHLSALSSLSMLDLTDTSLALSYPPIPRDTFGTLSKLKNLTCLDLTGTSVRDEDVDGLTQLTHLRELILEDCLLLTPQCFPSLFRMTSLHTLDMHMPREWVPQGNSEMLNFACEDELRRSGVRLNPPAGAATPYTWPKKITISRTSFYHHVPPWYQ